MIRAYGPLLVLLGIIFHLSIPALLRAQYLETLSHSTFPGFYDLIDVWIDGSTAYLVESSTGLLVVDFSNPYNPDMLGSCTPGNHQYQKFSLVNGNGLLTSAQKIYSLDVSDLNDVSVIDSVAWSAWMSRPCDAGVFYFENGMKFLTMDQEGYFDDAVAIDTNLSGNIVNIEYCDSYLYIVTQPYDYFCDLTFYDNIIYAYDVSIPDSPVYLGFHISDCEYYRGFYTNGDIALVDFAASEIHGTHIYTIETPFDLSQIDVFWDEDGPSGKSFFSEHHLLMSVNYGFDVYEIDSGTFQLTDQWLEGTSGARAFIQEREDDVDYVHYLFDASYMILASGDFGHASEQSSPANPSTITILPVYPNPFNNHAVVTISLMYPADVVISLHDILGHQVGRVADGRFSAGIHKRYLSGDHLASGTYLLYLQSGRQHSTQRVILVK